MSDKIISNMSYTNKDFQSIYNELLDLVKKITNKWDPSMSNESDPGVVLLKLNALIADKNNYNIDKNILECFPSTVTQDANARRIYDSLGYKMHWYKSALVDVGFQLKDASSVVGAGINIPAFTMLTDLDSEIVYTTLKDVWLSKDSSAMASTYTTSAIEGRVDSVKVNGSDRITLSNLDADNRIYFTESNVAENGIFIRNENSILWDEWQSVDNLASAELGKKFYEFGVLPNSNTCYIEFPSDIAVLLKDSDAFYINYIISGGAKGSIKANRIDSFLNDFVDDINTNGEVLNSDIRIIQPSASGYGYDPETIDDAYRNYKKTIGTFNTLVTKKDYENYIYNAKNSLNTDNIVSNCVVADRATDLNASLKVKTWVPNTDITESCVMLDSSNKPILNAYNIVVYGLATNTGDYDSTFKIYDSSLLLGELERVLNSVKTVQHDVITPNDLFGLLSPLFYIFENIFTINGQLITHNKVSSKEAKDIQSNVISALEMKYSSRMVEFGNETSYNDLLDTIKAADSRIKTISLNVPKYQIKAVTPGTTSEPVEARHLNMLEKLHIVARMILAGNVQLFKFDDNFTYDFGYESIRLLGSDATTLDDDETNIRAISTETKKAFSSVSDTHEVYANEVVQLYAPSLVTKVEYSTYVKYKYYRIGGETPTETFDAAAVAGKVYYVNNNGKFIESTSAERTAYFSGAENAKKLYEYSHNIPANENYVVTGSDFLRLVYTDANNTSVSVIVTAGQIINCSFDITAYYTESRDGHDNEDSSGYKVLNSGQTIAIKDWNTGSIARKTKCFWILNNPSNTLSFEPTGIGDVHEYVLQENEYFIYTSSSSDELVVYGSGTLLQTTTSYDKSVKTPNLSNINDIDVNSVNWHSLDIDITAIELEILTLTEGVTVGFSSNPPSGVTWPTGGFTIENKAKQLSYPITVTDKSESKTTYYKYISSGADVAEKFGDKYKISSRLGINTTVDKPQKIYKGQTIEFIYNYDSSGNAIKTDTISNSTGADNIYVAFNSNVVVSGGTSIDAAVLTDDGEDYLLKAYELIYSSDDLITRESGVITVTPPEGHTAGSSYSKDFKFKFSAIQDQLYSYTDSEDKTIYFKNSLKPNCWMIQVYVTKTSQNLSVSFKSKRNSSTSFNTTLSELTFDSTSTKTAFTESGYYMIKVPSDGTYQDFQVVLSNATAGDTVSIGRIDKVIGLNTQEIDAILDSKNSITEPDKFRIDNVCYFIDAMANYKKSGQTVGTSNVKTLLNSSKNNLVSNGDLILKASNDQMPADIVTVNGTTYELNLSKCQNIFSVIDNILNNSSISGSKFNYAYRVSDTDKVKQPTVSASYWNKNHVINSYTIPKIDFENSIIEVNYSSVK